MSAVWFGRLRRPITPRWHRIAAWLIGLPVWAFLGEYAEASGAVLANGSFEADGPIFYLNARAITGWSFAKSGAFDREIATAALSGYWVTDGSYSLRMWNHASSNMRTGEFACVSQAINFDGIDAFQFDVRLANGLFGGWNGKSVAEFLVDGLPHWSSGAAGAYPDCRVDVSSLAGVHEIAFRLKMVRDFSAGEMNSNWLYVDNVRAVPSMVAPVVLPPSMIAGNRFAARWSWAEGDAPEGELSVASDAEFTQPVRGYEALYRINCTECLVTNLTASRDYWYRVRRLMPDGRCGPWSSAMKVRSGKGSPAFTALLSTAPVAKGVSQQFAFADWVSGPGKLKVKSSDTNAVKVTLADGVLTLRYLWKSANTAKVTMAVIHPETGCRTAYGVTLSRAWGNVGIVGISDLTYAGGRLAQDLTLENRTGGMVYGLRIRAAGLFNPDWLINRTGLDPVSKAAIREIPCVFPAGSRLTVRLFYHYMYSIQSRLAPVSYKAWAVMTPVHDAQPETGELAIAQQERYDGLWLLGMPANRNRLYAVYHSDDGGAAWTLNAPVIRATANQLMWLDTDEGAPEGRLYRVMDAGK